MKESLLNVLSCPECSAPLYLEVAYRRFAINGVSHIVDGAIRCAASHRFPVIDEIPRVVPQEMLTAGEKTFLVENAIAEPDRHVEPTIITPSGVETLIRDAVTSAFGIDDTSSLSRRARVTSQVDYLIAEYHGTNKQPYVGLLQQFVSSPKSILDVGGSLPGLLGILRKRFDPGLAVVADLDIGFAEVFKTPNREIALIRADARRLPFRRGSFDLVVSAFLLEHVPDWRAALHSMTDVGKKCLIAFGPNRWFPFEIGHLDAPLAGTLPKSIAAYVTYAWFRMQGRDSSRQRIREILDGMSYISSHEFRRECVTLRLNTNNVFPQFIELVAKDTSAPPTLPRRIVRAWPKLCRALARVLAFAAFEPNVYHLLESSEPASGQVAAQKIKACT